jgi:hypothetical protein
MNNDTTEIRSRRKSHVDSTRSPARVIGASGSQIRPLEVVTPTSKIPDEHNFDEWMATDNVNCYLFYFISLYI